MSDSRDTPEVPVERPQWRFSGRRGTPVHLREQTPETLPREIRQAIVEMAREHSGERSSTPKSGAQPRGANKARPKIRQTTPPVAAAPTPVERRSREDAPAPIAASHVPPAVAPEHEAAPASEATPQPQGRILAGDAQVEIEVEVDLSQAPDTDPALPPATAGSEAGRQAAWELGRLPILLDAAVLPRSAEPEPPRSTPEPELTHGDAVELGPIAWRSVGANPRAADVADHETSPVLPPPDAIARLSAGIDMRSPTHADEHGVTRASTLRSADARHHVQRRRNDLRELVSSLGDLTTRRH